MTEHSEDKNTKLICRQLYDLAQIQNAPLSSDDMAGFIARSNEIMLILLKGGEHKEEAAEKEENAETAETVEKEETAETEE